MMATLMNRVCSDYQIDISQYDTGWDNLTKFKFDINRFNIISSAGQNRKYVYIQKMQLYINMYSH